MALVNKRTLIMSKKYISSAVIIIISLFVILTAAFYFGREMNKISPVNQIATNSNYSVAKQLEQFAKIAGPAVENFDTQDINESVNNRNNRLSIYFSGDSPVYSYKLQNITSTVTKTTSKAMSVESSESEGSSQNLTVSVETRIYSTDNKSTTRTQSYWVKLIKLQDGSLVVSDIGVNQ